MPADPFNDLGWIGLALIALVFLANALGVVDPSGAVRDLVGAGFDERGARRAVAGGRVFQLVAAAALFVPRLRPFAAGGLAVFLIAATLTGHAFWRKPPAERDGAVIGFLKNAAIVGGLILAAGWRTNS